MTMAHDIGMIGVGFFLGMTVATIICFFIMRWVAGIIPPFGPFR